MEPMVYILTVIGKNARVELAARFSPRRRKFLPQSFYRRGRQGRGEEGKKAIRPFDWLMADRLMADRLMTGKCGVGGERDRG